MHEPYTLVESALLKSEAWRSLSHAHARVALDVVRVVKAVNRVTHFGDKPLKPVDFSGADCSFRPGKNTVSQALKRMAALGLIKLESPTGRKLRVLWCWQPMVEQEADAITEMTVEESHRGQVTPTLRGNNRHFSGENPPPQGDNPHSQSDTTIKDKNSTNTNQEGSPSCFKVSASEIFDDLPILTTGYASLLQSFREILGMPLPREGTSRDHACRKSLADLVREDGYEEQDVLDCLHWMLEEEEPSGSNGFLWRIHLGDLQQLRRESSNGKTKFQNLCEKWRTQLEDDERASTHNDEWNPFHVGLLPQR